MTLRAEIADSHTRQDAGTGAGYGGGQDVAQAAQIAVDDLNEAGGVAGYTLELVIADTVDQRADAVTTAFNQLSNTEDLNFIMTAYAGASFMQNGAQVIFGPRYKIGKTRCHEFAYGVNEPPTRSPWELNSYPGGSSAGSGVALTVRSAFGAIGADTGGSIRIPASFNNIVGLKPTYGRVSAYGVVPLSWTLDHVGPMTRAALDNALMLQAIAGHDPNDATSARQAVPDYSAGIQDGAGLRARERYRSAMKDLFRREQLDALISPTMPLPTALLTELHQPRKDMDIGETPMISYIHHTFSANLGGQPAIS